MSDPAQHGDLRLALIGDVMPSRRLSPFDEPDYLALRELLHGADAAFANLETTVAEADEGYPNLTQGTPMCTPPRLLEELRWLGIDFVSCANNHATDRGTTGVAASIAHLRRGGWPFAGMGMNLAEASRPAYFDCRAGRIALVAVTAFFRPWNRASEQRRDTNGRPGINALEFRTIHEVPADAFAALQALVAHSGIGKAQQRMKGHFYSNAEAGGAGTDSLTLLGREFRRGTRYAVATQCDEPDAERTLAAVREARRQADWVVLSLHSHEFGGEKLASAGSDIELEEPAEFARAFARRAIDAGADVVAGHGPHLTLGVELYRGRPILYSLGNAVFQNDTIEVVPDESYRRFGLSADSTPADFLDARTDGDRKGFPASREYWEGIAATCDFAAGEPVALTLHPLELGFGSRRAQRGRPRLARGSSAQTILERVQNLSRPFGTKMVLENGAARIALGAATVRS